jgi:hypothetical protein
MSGPWEKFAQTAPVNTRTPSQEAGPWAKFSVGVTDLPQDPGSINEGISVAPPAGMGQGEGPGLGEQFQTQLENFGNVIAGNHLPHIQAFFEKYLSPDATSGVDEQLRAQGFQIPERGYVQMRDENINAQQLRNDRNPESALIGTAAGIVTQAPLIAKAATSLGLGQGAGLINRLKDAATTGFGLGAINNPGDTEGVVDPLQGQERFNGGLKGGAFGIAGQGFGEGLAKTGEVVRKAPEKLSQLANTSAFKSAGAMLKDFRAAFGKNSADEIGETLLNSGVVSAGDTIDDIAAKASQQKQQVGKVIGDTYRKTEEALTQAAQDPNLPRPWKLRLKATVIDGSRIARDAEAKLLNVNKNDTANSEILSKARASLDNLKKRGKSISMEDLLEIKSNLDADINYSIKAQEAPNIQQQLKVIRDVVNKAAQDRVRVAGGVINNKELINTLKTANKEYGHLATTEKVAKDRISRTEANNFFSLGDKIIGAAAGGGSITSAETPEDMMKSALKGFVVALASKGGRTYGNAALASSAKFLSSSLQKPAAFAKFGKPLIEAAKRSPQEFQALFNQFGKDPEFIRLAGPAGAK